MLNFLIIPTRLRRHTGPPCRSDVCSTSIRYIQILRILFHTVLQYYSLFLGQCLFYLAWTALVRFGVVILWTHVRATFLNRIVVWVSSIFVFCSVTGDGFDLRSDLIVFFSKYILSDFTWRYFRCSVSIWKPMEASHCQWLNYWLPVTSFLPAGGTHQHRPKNAHAPAPGMGKVQCWQKNGYSFGQSIILSTCTALARPQQVSMSYIIQDIFDDCSVRNLTKTSSPQGAWIT